MFISLCFMTCYDSEVYNSRSFWFAISISPLSPSNHVVDCFARCIFVGPLLPERFQLVCRAKWLKLHYVHGITWVWLAETFTFSSQWILIWAMLSVLIGPSSSESFFVCVTIPFSRSFALACSTENCILNSTWILKMPYSFPRSWVCARALAEIKVGCVWLGQKCVSSLFFISAACVCEKFVIFIFAFLIWCSALVNYLRVLHEHTYHVEAKRSREV